MNCPNCATTVSKSEKICHECGIIIDKYRPEVEENEIEPPLETEGPVEHQYDQGYTKPITPIYLIGQGLQIFNLLFFLIKLITNDYPLLVIPVSVILQGVAIYGIYQRQKLGNITQTLLSMPLSIYLLVRLILTFDVVELMLILINCALVYIFGVNESTSPP